MNKAQIKAMQNNNKELLKKLSAIVAHDAKFGRITRMIFPITADGGKEHFLSIHGLIAALETTARTYQIDAKESPEMDLFAIKLTTPIV